MGLPKSPVRTGKSTQWLVILSAPVPPTRHSTALRAATFVGLTTLGFLLERTTSLCRGRPLCLPAHAATISLARWMPRGFAEVAGTNWKIHSMAGSTFGSRTTHSTFHRAAQCKAGLETFIRRVMSDGFVYIISVSRRALHPPVVVVISECLFI